MYLVLKKTEGMCARLLACPLCSQPGFLTLDALRAGLISAATRPLMCPVCNEILLGIDKLTIHLFSHTINVNNTVTEPPKSIDTASNANDPAHNIQNSTRFQDWNMLRVQQSEIGDLQGNNIFHQVNDNNRTMLDQQQNVQNTVSVTSKSNCTQQYYCDNTIKHVSETQNNIILEDPKVQEYHSVWIDNFHQPCDQRKEAEMRQPEVNKIQQSISETTNSGNKEIITEDETTITLNNKEKFTDFQPFSSIMPISDNVSLKLPAEQKRLHDSTEANGNNNECEHRPNSMDILPHLKAIRISSTKEKTERCDICGFHFPDPNILVLHKELVHMANEKELDIVDGDFKNYSCHLCSKVFKMRGSLMVHMRVAHSGYNLGALAKDGETSGNGYNCPTCGKTFRKEQHVTQHLKTHEGKQWECDICSKMFTTKYFLKKHKRLHSGEMPYKCNICEKTFTFQQSYHKHRLYHKDDKPHTCTTCGRSFKELSTLHNHERIHTGEKPFPCETCGKCFRQRVSYLVHRRIHTGVMPYKCTLCGKNFRYKVSQRTHKCPAQPVGSATQQDNLVQKFSPVPDVQNASNELQTMQKVIHSEQNQTMSDIGTCEENKFVLIINSQGQHVLTRESNVNQQTNEERSVNCEGNSTIEKNLRNEAWMPANANNDATDKIAELGEKNRTHEKSSSSDVNDFFSIVMSPLENRESSNLSSTVPTVEKESSLDSYNNFRQPIENLQMAIIDTHIADHFSCDTNATNNLQTINEESLKQLLYGISKK